MQWFAGVDTDRSGHIDALELQRALMQGNLNFSLATVAHMIRMHDTDRTGNISFDRKRKLGSPLPPSLLPKARQRVQVQGGRQSPRARRVCCLLAPLAAPPTLAPLSPLIGWRHTLLLTRRILVHANPPTEFCAVHQFLGTAQASFMQFDRDRSGQLTLDEISMALNAQGFRLETTAFYALCAAFDPDRSASIGMAEYIAMSIFLQSCSRTFKAFDPQGTGQISLDYNQFVFAAAATK